MLTLRWLATAATAGFTAMTVALPAALATPTAPQADGVYRYSDATEPNVMGATYMTFELRQGRLLGAFYQPHSSFDCFVGEVAGDRLTLAVTESYSQDTYAYEMALVPSPVATQGDGPVSLNLAGLQPLPTVSALDHDLLNTCRAALGEPSR